MQTQADALFVQQYNSQLTHVLQPQGFLLDGMLMPEGEIVGTTAYWPIFGRMEANVKVRGVDAKISNPNMNQVSANLTTWENLGQTNDFDGTRMKANVQAGLVEAASMGIGRTVDKAAIGIINSGTFTAGNNFFDATTVGTGGTPAQLTAGMVNTLLSNWVGKNNISLDGDVFAGIPFAMHQQLMMDKTYANSQWVGDDLPFKAKGRTSGRTWNFVNWVILPDEYFPGWSPTGNYTSLDALIWSRKGVGWSTNKKVDSKWQYKIEFGGWLIRHESEGAGVLLLPPSVAKLRVATNLATLASV